MKDAIITSCTDFFEKASNNNDHWCDEVYYEKKKNKIEHKI